LPGQKERKTKDPGLTECPRREKFFFLCSGEGETTCWSIRRSGEGSCRVREEERNLEKGKGLFGNTEGKGGIIAIYCICLGCKQERKGPATGRGKKGGGEGPFLFPAQKGGGGGGGKEESTQPWKGGGREYIYWLLLTGDKSGSLARKKKRGKESVINDQLRRRKYRHRKKESSRGHVSCLPYWHEEGGEKKSSTSSIQAILFFFPYRQGERSQGGWRRILDVQPKKKKRGGGASGPRGGRELFSAFKRKKERGVKRGRGVP